MPAKKRPRKRHRARKQRKRTPFVGTLPRSPARLAALLERYSRVKRMLVEHLRTRCWDDILERAARYRDTGNDDDFSLITATEDVLHGWPKDGDEPHIIDSFVAEQPGLSAVERRMALRWKDVRRGVFRIDRRQGRRTRMHNLIDDFDYQVVISGLEDLESFAPGVFLNAVIVPLMDAWTLSGTQTILGAIDARAAYGLAAKLALQCPAEFFRNPEHLERSREIGRRQHGRFVSLFGQSWVVGTPQEIEASYREAIAGINRLAAAENPTSVAAQGVPPSALKLPPELRSADSVGMLCLPEEGLVFLADFRRFLDAFAEPAYATEVEYRRVVSHYLEDDSISAAVFELVAGADPDKAGETMRDVLGDPSFDWRLDADSLLRHYKPNQFERPPLPSVLAMSTEMVEGLRFLDQLDHSE